MSGELGEVRACVFDAYGTLFDVHAPAARLEATLHKPLAAISATWRAKQLEYTWLRTLMGQHADFWQVTREALDYALEAEGHGEDEELRRELLDLYHRCDAYPEVPRLLGQIHRAGMITAIFSNGAPDMLDSAVSAAGLGRSLDHVLSVEAVGRYKPTAESYQLVCDRLAMPAEAICFVSSNGFDVAGSALFGFQAVWVNRFDRPADRLPGEPRAVLADLRGLSDLLSL
jgi:2-haloacid dehalogenase